MAVTLEICAQGIESALASQEGGADRVELCEDLAVGGVTPSSGMIAIACRRLRIPVHVLIRPRGGDFVYSSAEFAVMRHDIEAARWLGAAGVVVGILRPDGSIDRQRLAQLIGVARPMTVTFHRAFDHVSTPLDSLDVLIEHEVERVLTSGGPARAVDGLTRLCELHRRSAGRIAILAGGRISASDIPTMLSAGLTELHFGSAACADGQVTAEKVESLRKIARESHR